MYGPGRSKSSTRARWPKGSSQPWCVSHRRVRSQPFRCLFQPRLARNQGLGQELGPSHASRSVTAIMITTSNSSVKRSGTPNQFLGVRLHTMAMSGLSRVRTELDPLLVVPSLTHHPDTGEPSVSVPSRPWRSSVHVASSGGDTCAPLRQTAHRDLRLHQQETQH